MAVNSKHVRAWRLVDPVEGRKDGAWLIEYRGEAFLTDPGGGNAEAFAWKGEAREPIESRAKVKAPTVGFDAMSREDVARELRINPALLAFVEQAEPGFPGPIVRFRDGPVWSAEAVEQWIPTRQPQDGRRTDVPRT